MFKVVLLEHMILCRMVQGQMPQAIKEVQTVALPNDSILESTHRYCYYVPTMHLTQEFL